MNCPKCESDDTKELFRSSDDNINMLSHSHLKCNSCGNEFNIWNESKSKLKEVFKDSIELYE